MNIKINLRTAQHHWPLDSYWKSQTLSRNTREILLTTANFAECHQAKRANTA